MQTAELLNGMVEAVPAAGATTSLRLHIGSGPVAVDGFEPIDRKLGREAYPLDAADGCVEEILASHILEHFSHREAGPVLKHWVEKLKPGGRIRLAVPDFEVLAKAYLGGEPINLQGYVMGGHSDADDHHGALFDCESLTELMIECGLERIGRWTSDLTGASSLPISLNLQGFKPAGPAPSRLSDVRICASTPRYGPLMHARCVERACMRLGIDGDAGQSCFWHQKLSEMMEKAIARPDCRFVVTTDFDTVFSPDDLLELYRLLTARPDVDAVFPLQAKRGCNDALFSLADGRGHRRETVTANELAVNLLDASTGHFGLTMFRADSLRRFPRPWMVPQPGEDGRWADGHVDADIDFWHRFHAAGLKVCMAPRVVVGHLEEVISWPSRTLERVYQQTADYDDNGIPAAVMR